MHFGPLASHCQFCFHQSSLVFLVEVICPVLYVLEGIAIMRIFNWIGAVLGYFFCLRN
jgi:hypothetical protein